MDTTAHVQALNADGKLLADAAERAGLLTAVPSCPGWQVRDLLRHQGYVHSWATRFVGEQLASPGPRVTEAEVLAMDPPSDADLLAWFRDGHAALVAALSGADPDVSCWTFLAAPSPLAFWARRQAHETAIHRTDAELAAGALTPFGTQFAADGIDELIMGFLARNAKRLPADVAQGPYRSIELTATDAEQSWHVDLTAEAGRVARVSRLGPEGQYSAPGVPAGTPGAQPDCELAGPAAGLYLLLWNRASPADAGVTVSGDPGALVAWRGGVHITW